MSHDEPDLALVYDALTAYQRSAALKAAVELDVFTHVAAGATTLPALAAACRAAERGVRALCNRLVVDGLLRRDGERWVLTATSATFLDRRSLAYIGGAAAFCTSPHIVGGFDRLVDAVRKGGTAVPDDGTLAPEHPVWVEFARGMGPVARGTALVLGNLLAQQPGAPRRVLDVAAGHGMFGIVVAGQYPAAEVWALDWPNVLAVAEENAAAAGVAGRFHLLPGSAFDVDWGRDYDLVLVPNFLHHFDVPTCERVLRKAHAALAPGGRVAIVEFVPDDDRSGPPPAVAFALVMLAGTAGGDAWTFAEYRAMLEAAGFHDPRLHDLAPTPHRAVLAVR